MAQLFERAGKDEISLEEYGRFAGGPPGQQGRPDPAQMFQRFDTNNDGKITKDEIPEPMRERLAPAFERLGKTELTREDFAEATRRMSQPGPDGRPMDGPMIGRPPAFFRLADANGDGKLTKDELAKVADKFSELDRNKDGSIDVSELMGGPPPGMAQGGGRPEMQRLDNAPNARPAAGGPGSNPFFARMDANGDGKITKDEAPDRMKENFARMDKNSDGFLTQEELQGAFEGQGRPRPGQPGQPKGDAGRPKRPQPE